MQQTAAPQHIAAVDIGSNTLHLIVAAVDPVDQHLTILSRQVDIIRLGADVAQDGAIGPERAARAEASLRAMAALAAQHGATHRIAVATEGVRAASNAAEMLQRFGAAWGAPITLISGLEEAALTFWGATSAAATPTDRLAVGDLGGGSCEIVVGQAAPQEVKPSFTEQPSTSPQRGEAGTIIWAQSLPLGSNRLLAAVTPADPPSTADIAALTAQARQVLATVAAPDLAVRELIAVGGTANSIARILHPSDTVPLEDRHILTTADLDAAIALLAADSSASIAASTHIELERAQILVGGTVAWREIIRWLGMTTMTVSQRGVREGAIIAWLRAGDGWQAYARQAADNKS